MRFDPYRALFPIGLFLGAWGVGSWLLYGFKLTSEYPGTYHASLMIGGFLFLLAVGFLMTAVPAFTTTSKASAPELFFAITLALGLGVAAVASKPMAFHGLVLAEMIFLIVYGIRRVVRRQDDPPPEFLFVGLGILCGLAGILILFLEDLGPVSSGVSILGHNLFFQGMMLSLVLGVGSRLIPALTGWEEMPLDQIKSSRGPKASFFKTRAAFLVILMILFVASFFIEGFVHLEAGRVLRALVTTLIAFRFWHLFRRPREKTWLALWLWISGWCVVAGLWGYALVPTYGIHLVHITFVGGFSLMALMIATRVTIAHGDEEYDLEEKSKALKWAGIFILAAAATRVLAPFTLGAYRSHLGYASLTWIVGLILWGWVFFKRILIVRS